MGSIYRSGGSGGGSIYRQGGGHNYAGPSSGGGGKSKKSGHRHGIGGFFHNAYTDVEQGITGLPALAVHTAESVAHDVRQNPWLVYAGPATFIPGEIGLGVAGRSQLSRDVAVPLAKSVAYTWTPLLAHGDLGETLARVEQHPLSLLDLAAGAGIAAKGLRIAGLAEEAPRAVTLRSPGAIAGQEAKVVTRPVVGGDLTRRLKIGADQALKRLPPDFPAVGEQARFARAVRVQGHRTEAGLSLRARRYLPAERALTPKERVAANLIHDYPTKALLRDYKTHLGTLGTDQAKATLRVISDPKVTKLFEQPTKKMRVYLEESAGLGREQAGLLGLKDTEQRLYLPALLARGAKYEGNELVAPGRRTIPAMIDQIKQEATAEGRPLPTYRPHASVENLSGTATGAGGLGVQRFPVSQSHGVLATMGRVAYDIDTLGPAFFRTVKWAVYKDRHQALVDSAVRVPISEGLRPGNVYVRRSIAERVGHALPPEAGTKPERIGYIERTTGEFDKRLKDLVPDPQAEGLPKGLHDELTTVHPEDAAVDEQGFRLQIPEKVATRVTGEFVRESKTVGRILSAPLQVWRALILNLSPHWLVGNIVGNSFLYAIKNAGHAGLRSYLQAVSDTKGVQAAWRLVSDRAVRSHLTPDDIAEILPEQMQGTFFGTQVPKNLPKSLQRALHTKIGRAAGTIPRGLRGMDVSYEQALRRAMINRLVRTDPEFKRFYEKLPKEERQFRAAAKRHLKTQPELADRISKEVNDTLGDFLSLTDFEKRVIRVIEPFWAWYRAITLVAVKLPIDHPIRADILLRLGQIGDEYTNDYGLPFLAGATPVGDYLLKTRGLNPLTTPIDTARAHYAGLQAYTGFMGKPNPNDAFNFVGSLNPFIAAPIVAAQAAAQGDAGKASSGLKGIATGLPQVRILNPPPSKLYTGPEYRDLLNYLGVPLVKVNPAEARKRAGR